LDPMPRRVAEPQTTTVAFSACLPRPALDRNQRMPETGLLQMVFIPSVREAPQPLPVAKLRSGCAALLRARPPVTAKAKREPMHARQATR
jgi:hypothetical protein